MDFINIQFMSDEKIRKGSPRFILQFVALAILLIGFPAGSWYYLQKGLDQRKAIFNELKQLGQLRPYALNLQNADSLEFTELAGKVKIVGFVEGSSPADAGMQGNALQLLHDQFDNRDDVLFLLHFTEASDESVAAFAAQYELDDPDQCFFLKLPGQQFERGDQ